MESLFDLDKPYFANWRRLYVIDTSLHIGPPFLMFTIADKRDAFPLYYAALCGFQNLVEYLIAKYPQHINASGGFYVRPLVAALGGRHFQTAELLRHSGADPNVQGYGGNTPLHSAALYADVEMVKVLLNLEADVNIRNKVGAAPLDAASAGLSGSDGEPNFPQVLANVTRLLLDNGADIDARNNHGSTSLHFAVSRGRIEVVRVLLEHGANIGAENNKGETPLAMAKEYQYHEFVKLLSEYGT